jgi:hypothetical protein
VPAVARAERRSGLPVVKQKTVAVSSVPLIGVGCDHHAEFDHGHHCEDDSNGPELCARLFRVGGDTESDGE